MKISGFILIGCLLLLFTFTQVPLQAQAPDDLIWVNDGDIWSYNVVTGEWLQYTTWGRNYRAVLSPDGTKIAYRAYAQLAIDYADAPHLARLEYPTDIWLLPQVPDSSQSLSLAQQPEGARFDAESDYFIVRSDPAWSWDSTTLAWTEYLYPNDVHSLVLYNVASREKQVIPLSQLPYRESWMSLYDVRWGDEEIFVHFENDFWSYSLKDQTVTPLKVYRPQDIRILDFRWTGQRWLAIDLAGRELALESTGWHFTTEPLFFRRGGTALSTSRKETEIYSWIYWDQAGNSQPLPYKEPLSYLIWHKQFTALSPDGQTVAYLQYPRIGTPEFYLWQNGDARKITVPETQAKFGGLRALTWGGDVREEAASVPTVPTDTPQEQQNTCSSALTLTPGAHASVTFTDGAPLNMRETASRGGTIVERIPEGTTVSLIEGPNCAENLVWWNVQLEDGQVGWVAEGVDGTAFLEPAP